MLNSVPDPLITARKDQETITFQNSPWQAGGNQQPLWHICADRMHPRAAPQPRASLASPPLLLLEPEMPKPPDWEWLDLRDPPTGIRPGARGPQSWGALLLPHKPRMAAR